ncbi:MAG: 4'-phosphopantetheinyl transferase family protein [Myxococcota bacterium]
MSVYPPHPHAVIFGREVPTGSAWLTPDEQEAQACLHGRRLSDWRAGRWAVKQLLASTFGVTHPGDIDVRNAPDGCPTVLVRGWAAGPRISISHRAGRAAAACSADGRPIGIDLEVIEPRSDRFIRDFFTTTEADRCLSLRGPDRDVHAVTIWSAKEGVLKCIRTGLRRDTRSVEVTLTLPTSLDEQWHPFQAIDLDGGGVHEGWWRIDNAMVFTLTTPTGSDRVPVHELAGRSGCG